MIRLLPTEKQVYTFKKVTLTFVRQSLIDKKTFGSVNSNGESIKHYKHHMGVSINGDTPKLMVDNRKYH